MAAGKLCYAGPVPTIRLNGEARPLPDGATVTDLLRTLNLDPQTVAVERNREIVPRPTYDQTHLEEGDSLEIVTFVGGG